ncbi:pyridoxal-phosphate dependent enzyme [Sulfitobacter porphyrae]|jgi:1-aminocyclopropane-1-carboxylate deaminase|uniref:Pyridoxal-phosphate dependent enzyme n=1 Tax=Sulfitobacter porphyrae TaxID=1246864 RepID=A0ABW2B8A6_9RHOB
MSLLEKFERYPLTYGKTPIDHLPRLTAALGGKVEIYAKRDDCNSGLAMGGNKLRKLEYIVPDAIASGADTLVSIGGVQSNHTRMVAATAAKIGMKCVVVQEKWVPHFDAVYDRVGNILMTRLMGADSRLVDDGFDIGIRESWENAMQSVRDAGASPMAFRRAPPCINTARWAISALPRKWRSRKKSWASSSITSWSASSPARHRPA